MYECTMCVGVGGSAPKASLFWRVPRRLGNGNTHVDFLSGTALPVSSCFSTQPRQSAPPWEQLEKIWSLDSQHLSPNQPTRASHKAPRSDQGPRRNACCPGRTQRSDKVVRCAGCRVSIARRRIPPPPFFFLAWRSLTSTHGCLQCGHPENEDSPCPVRPPPDHTKHRCTSQKHRVSARCIYHKFSLNGT